ncbi:hypothetical protein I4U23_021791 [Adineta vaga]|nr:hypothetical protein I4U23_021791 [Adineta vaga]
MNLSLLNENNHLNISSIELSILYGIAIIGISINILIIIYLILIAIYRIKSSCFLFHHCLICLTLSIICYPYRLSYLNYHIRCDYLANIQVTCVTAQLLNIAAMVASEAYRFEDLIHQDFSSTISCGCLSFGLLIIWFSSVILHLGITMIGSESKSYYINERSCNFLIRDIRGYVLTLMWIIIIIFSLIITLRYIHKMLNEVSLKRRNNQPLLSLAILGQCHGEKIASKDILMQQIEQRIKLNILLIILFIIFWFPLFILTLFDIKFKFNKQILRYFLLFAWSNSSLSSLTYLLFLFPCNDICFLFKKKDQTSTYDSLTSYYNRIGDRFHDIGKWDDLNKENSLKLDQINTNQEDNSILIKEIPFNTKQHHSSTNGLIVTTNKHEQI